MSGYTRSPRLLKAGLVVLDAEIDTTDSLEHPDQNAKAVALGSAPQFAPPSNEVKETSTTRGEE